MPANESGSQVIATATTRGAHHASTSTMAPAAPARRPAMVTPVASAAIMAAVSRRRSAIVSAPGDRRVQARRSAPGNPGRGYLVAELPSGFAVTNNSMG